MKNLFYQIFLYLFLSSISFAALDKESKQIIELKIKKIQSDVDGISEVFETDYNDDGYADYLVQVIDYASDDESPIAEDFINGNKVPYWYLFFGDKNKKFVKFKQIGEFTARDVIKIINKNVLLMSYYESRSDYKYRWNKLKNTEELIGYTKHNEIKSSCKYSSVKEKQDFNLLTSKCEVSFAIINSEHCETELDKEYKKYSSTFTYNIDNPNMDFICENPKNKIENYNYKSIVSDEEIVRMSNSSNTAENTDFNQDGYKDFALVTRTKNGKLKLVILLSDNSFILQKIIEIPLKAELEISSTFNELTISGYHFKFINGQFQIESAELFENSQLNGKNQDIHTVVDFKNYTSNKFIKERDLWVLQSTCSLKNTQLNLSQMIEVIESKELDKFCLNTIIADPIKNSLLKKFPAFEVITLLPILNSGHYFAHLKSKKSISHNLVFFDYSLNDLTILTSQSIPGLKKGKKVVVKDDDLLTFDFAESISSINLNKDIISIVGESDQNYGASTEYNGNYEMRFTFDSLKNEIVPVFLFASEHYSSVVGGRRGSSENVIICSKAKMSSNKCKLFFKNFNFNFNIRDYFPWSS